MGSEFIQEQELKNKEEVLKSLFENTCELINHLSYDLADIKTLLFDVSNCTRGLGGVKQSFKIEDLPSSKKEKEKKNEEYLESIKNETEEERLERHREFFSGLKKSFQNK